MNKHVKTFLLCVAITVLAVLAFYAGSLKASIETLETAGKVAGDYAKGLATSAENEAKAVQELAAKSRLEPLPPGEYQLRVLGRDGERIFKIQVKHEGGVLQMSMPDSPAVKTVKISEDGMFFDWWSKSYGDDRYIGLRTEDGVFGRVYFSHGFDIGVEQFWIESDDPRQPPAPPHVRTPKPRQRS